MSAGFQKLVPAICRGGEENVHLHNFTTLWTLLVSPPILKVLVSTNELQKT